MKITRQIKIFEYYLYDNPFKKNREYTEIGRLQLSDESTTSELVVGSVSGDLYIEADDLLDKLIGINFITEWRTYISGFIVNQLFDRPSFTSKCLNMNSLACIRLEKHNNVMIKHFFLIPIDFKG